MLLREENGFLPISTSFVASQPKNEAHCITTRTTPTGSLMDETFLKEVVAIAQWRRVCLVR